MDSDDRYLYQNAGEQASEMNMKASGRGGGSNGGQTELRAWVRRLATRTCVFFGKSANAAASTAAMQVSGDSVCGASVK